MNIAKDIEPVTTLKRDAAELISRAKNTGSPVVITQNGKPTAVLQDVDSFQRQKQLLHILKLVAQGERDYEAGRTLTHTEARKRFDERLLQGERPQRSRSSRNSR